MALCCTHFAAVWRQRSNVHSMRLPRKCRLVFPWNTLVWHLTLNNSIFNSADNCFCLIWSSINEHFIQLKITRFYLIKYYLITHHSIAFEMLYQKSFHTNSIGWSVQPQTPENYRRRQMAFPSRVGFSPIRDPTLHLIDLDSKPKL